MSLYQNLTTNFPKLNFKKNEPLSQYVQLGLGGPAEVFWQAKNYDQFIAVVKFARSHQLPLTLLGWGSNVLIADRGLKGLVVKNEVIQINLLKKESLTDALLQAETELNQYLTQPHSARWQIIGTNSKLKKQKSNSANLSHQPKSFIYISISAGTPLPLAINQLLSQNILGLHHFIRIPGTIGGAIVNNIHGGQHLIGEFVLAVEVIDHQGNVKLITQRQLEFKYDHSRFHHTDEVITKVYFRLTQSKNNLVATQEVTNMIQHKTSHHPKSLGCVWQNLDATTQKKLNLPTPSAGYVIDKLLKLKGLRVGGAHISDKHAAFILINNQATSQDYLELMKQIKQQAQTKLKIDLKPEIFFLGFTKAELEGII